MSGKSKGIFQENGIFYKKIQNKESNRTKTGVDFSSVLSSSLDKISMVKIKLLCYNKR